MAQLSDFQAQLSLITAAVDAIGVEIQTLQTNAAATMSSADEATLLGELQDLATRLQAIVPAATPAQS